MRTMNTFGIKLPTIMIVEPGNRADILTCRLNHLPYMITTLDDRTLLAMILMPTLKKKFPGIKWQNVINIPPTKELVVKVPVKEEVYESNPEGLNATDEDNISDVAEERRCFIGGNETAVSYCNMNIGAFAGSDCEVDVDVLMDLELLPSFITDITQRIVKDACGVTWREGYTKKLGVCLGNTQNKPEERALIIIDASASIPRGIADTMIAMCDTLRSRLNADLIITSAKSYIWKAGEEIPDPRKIHNMVGRSNERAMFAKIIEGLDGTHYSNVFSFGDCDSPEWCWVDDKFQNDLHISVENVWHFHTHKGGTETGYAEWCKRCNPSVHEEFNTSWCNMVF